MNIGCWLVGKDRRIEGVGVIWSDIWGLRDENESKEFGESWIGDWEYEDDIGLLNIAYLGGFLSPAENAKLVGLLFIDTVAGEYEGDGIEEK